MRLAEGIDQKALMQAMLDRGVATRRGIMNMHQEAAHGDLPTVKLPRSVSARDTAILLPLYAQMTDADQDRVLSVLDSSLAAVVRCGHEANFATSPATRTEP